MEQHVTTRDSYLITKAIRSFIFASILTAAIGQLIVVTHAVIVGQLLSPHAMSAISMAAPVMMIPTMIYLLLASGATVLASKAAGERDYQRAAQVFTVSVGSTLVFSLLFSLLFTAFGQQFAVLLCSDSILQPYVVDYLPIAAGLSFITVVFQTLSLFTGVDGHPQRVSRIMLLSLLLIAVFDVVFIRFLGMGIRSTALATALADLIAAIYLWVGFRHSVVYHLCWPKGQLKGLLAKNLKTGAPQMLGLLLLAFFAALLNGLVVNNFGAVIMFTFSIAISLINLVNLFTTGASQTFRAIGGMFYGQRDYAGLRMLNNRLILLLVCVGIVCTLLGECLTPQLAMLYGADTPALIASASGGLRIMLLMLVPFMIQLFLPAVYIVLGHLRLVTFSVMLFNVMMAAVVFLFCQMGRPDLIWWTFPIAGWGGLLLMMLVTYKVHLSQPDSHPLTLLPSNDGFLDRLFISVSATREAFEKAIDDIHQFVLRQQLQSQTAYAVDACAEELLKNIMEHARLTSRHFVDVSVTRSDSELILTIKDDGRPFNPFVVTDENRHLGLSIVTGLCSKTDYNYQFGQNMTFLTFTYNQ